MFQIKYYRVVKINNAYRLKKKVVSHFQVIPAAIILLFSKRGPEIVLSLTILSFLITKDPIEK